MKTYEVIYIDPKTRDRLLSSAFTELGPALSYAAGLIAEGLAYYLREFEAHGIDVAADERSNA